MLPNLQIALDGPYKDENVQFLAISMGDEDWYLEGFKEEMGSQFSWLILDKNLPNPHFFEVFESYELDEYYSTIIVLDKAGIVRYRDYGGGTAGKDLDDLSALDYVGELLQEAKADAAPDVGNQAGQQAIDFTLTSIEDTPLTLSDFFDREKPIMITFWGSGCVRCGIWVPGLFAQEVLNQYGPENLFVLGVDLFSPLQPMRDFVENMNITYPVLQDASGNVSAAYQASGEFIFLLLDANGVILYRGEEYDETIYEILDEVLAQPIETT